MLGGPKRKTSHDKKKEKDDNNNNNNTNTNASGSNDPPTNSRRVAELEARVESLQKAVRERDSAINELKEKTTKQEKKIEDQQRAKARKEKDAIIGELKQRISRQQQKKDNQTMARLAMADSPVTKSVVDRTLQENNDLQKELEKAQQGNKELHLRMEAVLLQANEEKRLHQEAAKAAEKYRGENARLEREIEHLKSEMRRVQLQMIELQESLHIVTALNKHPNLSLSLPLTSSSSSTSPPPSDVPTSPRGAGAPTSPRGVAAPMSPRGGGAAPTSPPRDGAVPAESPRGVTVPPPFSDSPSPSHSPRPPPDTTTTTTTSPSPTPTPAPDATTPQQGEKEEGNESTPNHTHPSTTTPDAAADAAPAQTQLEEESPLLSSLEDDTLTALTNTLTSSATTSRTTSFDLGAVDLSDLAKGLDEFPSLHAVTSSSSEMELMRSLDTLADSSAQPVDFASLITAKQGEREREREGLEGAISPTARLDVQEPFQDLATSPSAAYDHDFMEMFIPPEHNHNHMKVKAHSPALNNLFYMEEDITSSPPKFNLEGIDTSFLNNNHDLLPLQRARSPSHAPSYSEPVLPLPPLAKSTPPVNSSSSHANHHHLLHHSPQSPLHRSVDDSPMRGNKGHKSIFSLFSQESDTRNGTNDTPPDSTPATRSSPSSSPTPNDKNNNTNNNANANANNNENKAHDELFLNFGSKADINKVGLRRAKKVNFASFSAGKGKVKVEPTMEDTHFCIYPYTKTKTRALFAVFDGHAGRAAADDAVDLFPKEFSTQLEAKTNVSEAFLNTFANVDNAMKKHEYLGTTATVVYLWKKGDSKYLQAANVGDSTAFLCRNGVATRLTVDHKPSLQEEKERMRLAGVEISDSQTRINGLAVSRSLGNHFVKEQNIGMIAVPYVGDCIEILPTDTHLIVASDGLWDVVNSQHAMDIIRGMDALPGASLLLSTALQSNKCNDNVTVIVVRLN